MAQHCRIPRHEGSEFAKGRRFGSVICAAYHQSDGKGCH